jgi:hypothetical protein
VVVNNFNLLGMAISPDKTDPPLVINANAVLPQPIATQCLQAIGSKNPRLVAACSCCNLRIATDSILTNRATRVPLKRISVSLQRKLWIMHR